MRSSRKSKKSQSILWVILSVIVIALLVGAGFYLKDYIQNDQDKGVTDRPPTEQPTPPGEPDPEPEQDTFTNIRIAAAGDIMFHSTQLESAYDEKSKTYDFKPVFEDVKPIFTDADLALANYETTAAGSDKEYTGYPAFNSPDETFDAIKDAGIDVLTTANNHSLDTGSQGLKRTVEVLREKGLHSVGTYDTKPDSRVLMQEVKGVKIAILSYTESTNGLGDQYPADELDAMINLMDEDSIKEDIKEAKDLEADLIISFMHWGIEYAEEPNVTQVEFAEMMAKEGVDIILGSHPHVIQKSEVLEVDDHEAFVIYSMGNFVSNQRKETLDNDLTEDGIIVNFDIQKNNQTGETTVKNVEYVPTWVYRHKEKGDSTYTYRILPIEEFLDGTDISKAFKERMKRSLEATVSKMKKEPF